MSALAIVRAPVGALGLDFDTRATAEQYKAIRAAGYLFVCRYLSFQGQHDRSHDLDAPEMGHVFGAGLGLVVVQHVRFEGWRPAESLGILDGQWLAQQARELGLPDLAPFYTDLEGTASDARPSDEIGYLEAWARQLGAYSPGAYCGAGLHVSGELLGAARGIHSYWRSLSRVVEPYPRGFRMMQLTGAPVVVAGVEADVSVTQHDFFGQAAMWMGRPA
jgi:hypothetical protein